MSNTEQLPWEISKIINVSNDLATHGSTGGSTGEVIAAAFVLDRMEFLPHGYTVIEAWERLDDQWQGYVKRVKRDYRHKLVPW